MFPIFAGNSASTGYNLTRSLRTRASASAYLSRTPASAGNQKTWTYSNWIKRGTLGVNQQLFTVGTGSGLYFYLRFLSTDVLEVFTYDAGVGSFVWQLQTTQVFRDPSAWYHIIISTDTTQATASNRVKVYINGTQVTAFAIATYPSLNYDTRYNVNVASYINSYVGASAYFDGYSAEFNSVDGQALTPSSFGSTNALTGVWQPARYTGTYGTNGFYLPFTDNSALTTSSNVGLGKDFSGNGNYWTTNNISITAGVTYDSMTDVPTLTSATAANFAVLNPLASSSFATLSGGNLNSSGNSATDNGCVLATIGNSSGKWYWEETIGTVVSSYPRVGAMQAPAANGTYPGIATASAGYVANGGIQKNGSTLATVATFTTGDVIGMALDLTNLTFAFYKNNALQYTVTALTAGTYFSGHGQYNGSTSSINFGQRPFTYTPPSGFVALNTFNIAAGTVTTSGSFTGNLSADGPFVYLNGVPTAMTINGNAVTFGTHADKLANGFKVRSSSALYNLATSNTYSVTTNGAVTKYANAQGNP